MMTKKIFIVLTFALLFTSCSMTGHSIYVVPGHEDSASLFVGPVWKWAYTVNKDGRELVPPEPMKYTVQFLEAGILRVKADCNAKGGTYFVNENRLTIEITHSTRAACEAGSLEDQFVRDLMAGETFFLKDRNLSLDLKYDSGQMKFIAEEVNYTQ
jgi:heat shock protein HslJ